MMGIIIYQKALGGVSFFWFRWSFWGSRVSIACGPGECFSKIAKVMNGYCWSPEEKRPANPSVILLMGKTYVTPFRNKEESPASCFSVVAIAWIYNLKTLI